MRLILWRVLDLYSHKFNDNWGFPTSCCVPTSPVSSQKHICHAIDSSPKLFGVVKEIVDTYGQRHLTTVVLAVFLIVLFFLRALDQFDFLFVCTLSLLVFTFIALIWSGGRVNLPYILARLKIIEPNDVHHGTVLLPAPLFGVPSSSLNFFSPPPPGIDLAAWTSHVFFCTLAVIVCSPLMHAHSGHFACMNV